MSELIVLTFNDVEQAGEVLEALKKLEPDGLVNIEDAAVVVKDESGEIKVKNQMSSGVKGGAVLGGMLGLLLGLVFFPVAGLVIGAIGGALLGKSVKHGIDKQFVAEVTDSIKPGMSALFVIGSGTPAAVRGTLEHFHGDIYQTTLAPEGVEALEEALKD